MAGLLSGLAKFGLSDLENAKLFEEEKEEKAVAAEPQKKKEVVFEEKDYLYDKTYDCPVCSRKATAKTVRSAKLRLIKNDWDLRAVYEGIDIHKYDTVVCNSCGYAALTKYFGPMLGSQIKQVRENICEKIKWTPAKGDTYTYEEAMERYKLALVCTIVKRGKSSEKAYICLKAAWVLRGYREELEKANATPETKAKIEELKKEEEEYLQNAMEGFINAKMTEEYPICGMDQTTLDLLLAELHYHFKDYTMASKIVSAIMITPGINKRIKDKAYDLKEEIVQALKKEKEA